MPEEEVGGEAVLTHVAAWRQLLHRYEFIEILAPVLGLHAHQKTVVGEVLPMVGAALKAARQFRTAS